MRVTQPARYQNFLGKPLCGCQRGIFSQDFHCNIALVTRVPGTVDYGGATFTKHAGHDQTDPAKRLVEVE